MHTGCPEDASAPHGGCMLQRFHSEPQSENIGNNKRGMVWKLQMTKHATLGASRYLMCLFGFI